MVKGDHAIVLGEKICIILGKSQDRQPLARIQNNAFTDYIQFDITDGAEHKVDTNMEEV